MPRARNAGGPHEECGPVQSQEPLHQSLRSSRSTDFVAQGTHTGLFRKRSKVGAAMRSEQQAGRRLGHGCYPEGSAICYSKRKALERGHGQF